MDLRISVLLLACLHQISDSYIIWLPQSRAMILTVLFALVALATLLQEEDVPFSEEESLPRGPHETV